jgi:hypothetical protein
MEREPDIPFTQGLLQIGDRAICVTHLSECTGFIEGTCILLMPELQLPPPVSNGSLGLDGPLEARKLALNGFPWFAVG